MPKTLILKGGFDAGWRPGMRRSARVWAQGLATERRLWPKLRELRVMRETSGEPVDVEADQVEVDPVKVEAIPKPLGIDMFFYYDSVAKENASRARRAAAGCALASLLPVGSVEPAELLAFRKAGEDGAGSGAGSSGSRGEWRVGGDIWSESDKAGGLSE